MISPDECRRKNGLCFEGRMLQAADNKQAADYPGRGLSLLLPSKERAGVRVLFSSKTSFRRFTKKPTGTP